MSNTDENIVEVLTDAVKASSELIKTVNDTLPNTTIGADRIGAVFFEWFESVCLYKLKESSLRFQYKLQDFKNDLGRKIAEIPENQLNEPKLSIVGPIFDSLKYNIDEKILREMYLSLLASSVNSGVNNSVHPSFVEIINQMSCLDAQFIELFKFHSTYPCLRLRVKRKDDTITPFPYLLFDFKDKNELFPMNLDYLKLTSCVDNLLRLGIIILNKEIIELGYDYTKFASGSLYVAFMKNFEDEALPQETRYRLELTSFGNNFIKCCF